jgi:predicted dehydrogenase
MGTPVLRIGIAGCGQAARIHLERLLAEEGVAIAGCADPDVATARALADRASGAQGQSASSKPVPAFADHRELLRKTAPDALAIFSPHLGHYRPAMDALQAGCHVFIEKPLSTNLQEAADIVALARARDLKVGVGHQYRLAPSLAEARRRLAEGVIGPVRLVSATLARPWLTTLGRAESAWRFDPKSAGGGILADVGDHLVDALLWTTGQIAHEVGAVQSRREPDIDLVTAAAIRLADGTPATVAISGVSPGTQFAIEYFGELGRLRATDQTLEEEPSASTRQDVPLPPPDRTIDGDFVAALRGQAPLCCPAQEAIATVRLLEAIARSAATRQVVRLM